MVYIDLFFVSLFSILVLLAIISDTLKLEIPNSVCVILAITFLPAAVLHGLPLQSIMMHYGMGVALFLGGLILFSFKIMGGGDVKLIAVIGIWLGSKLILPFIILFAMIGAGLALFVILLKYFPLLAGPLKTLPWLSPENKTKKAIPYGIAIGIAGLTLIRLTDIGGTALLFFKG